MNIGQMSGKNHNRLESPLNRCLDKSEYTKPPEHLWLLNKLLLLALVRV